MNILVVDDKPQMRDLIGNIVTESGHTPIFAGGYQEAVEAIAREGTIAFATVDGDLGDRDWGITGDSGRLILEQLVPRGIPYVRWTGSPMSIPASLTGRGIMLGDYDARRQALIAQLLALQ